MNHHQVRSKIVEVRGKGRQEPGGEIAQRLVLRQQRVGIGVGVEEAVFGVARVERETEEAELGLGLDVDREDVGARLGRGAEAGPIDCVSGFNAARVAGAAMLPSSANKTSARRRLREG